MPPPRPHASPRLASPGRTLLVAAAAAAALPGPAPFARAREDTVLLLHTNDLHGHVENAPALAALARAERARRRDVLWLDAGDVISGTPVSTLHRGTPVFRVLAAMGVDAATLGNHEFDHGAARIADFRAAAPFPILAANAFDAAGALLADAAWTAFDVDGVRVGVMGILSERTPGSTVRRGNEGVRFEPSRAAVERLLPEVRAAADVVVLLSHRGYEADVELARSVRGIDVILGGHTHTDLPGPVAVGSTIVAQAYRYGERLGRVDLTVDLKRRRVVRWEGSVHAVDPGRDGSDPAVAALVRDLEATVEPLVRPVIGRATRDLARADLLLVARAAFRDALRADFGFQNEYGVRAGVAAGPVTVRDVWTAFPFDDTLVRVRCAGRSLPDWLREEAAREGRPVDPTRVYTIATSTFVADHLAVHFPGAERDVTVTAVPVRDAVVAWIRRRGTVP